MLWWGMGMRVYADTNVYLDYCKGRTSKLRPFDDFAHTFFSRGWECLFHLVISDWIIEELEKFALKEDINIVLEYFREKGKLIEITYDGADVEKAKRMSRNWTDSLHVVLAMKAGCDMIATRNIKDFLPFSSKICISHPESI